MTEDSMPETVTLEWLGRHLLAQRVELANLGRRLDVIEAGLDGIRDDIKMLTGAVMYRAGDEMVAVRLIAKVERFERRQEELDQRLAHLEQTRQ